MKAAAALMFGVLFAWGLGISGMSRPEVVLGFLDILGDWNPALMFVMGSAVPIYMAVWFARSGKRPLLGGPAPRGARHDLDTRMFVGATLFGIGWGLCGICPGPALTLLGRPSAGGLLFVACMLCGMLLYRVVDARRAVANPA